MAQENESLKPGNLSSRIFKVRSASRREKGCGDTRRPGGPSQCKAGEVPLGTNWPEGRPLKAKPGREVNAQAVHGLLWHRAIAAQE